MNEAKLGASAVARLSRKNIVDEARDTYMRSQHLCPKPYQIGLTTRLPNT